MCDVSQYDVLTCDIVSLSHACSAICSLLSSPSPLPLVLAPPLFPTILHPHSPPSLYTVALCYPAGLPLYTVIFSRRSFPPFFTITLHRPSILSPYPVTVMV